MQHLEVSCAVRPLKWSLGVKWLIGTSRNTLSGLAKWHQAPYGQYINLLRDAPPV